MLSQGEEDNAGRRKKTQQDDHGFRLGGLLEVIMREPQPLSSKAGGWGYDIILLKMFYTYI